MSTWEAVSGALAQRAGRFAKASESAGTAVVVVDSHTEGEPTRVVIAGGPDLGGGTPEERRQRFDADHGAWRKGVVDEPRGSEAVVGALILPPTHPEALATVLFFNNVGSLRMCVHGTIGVMETLARRAGLAAGTFRLDTPAGAISATLEEDGSVSVTNVVSRRVIADVTVEVGGRRMTGDVAWAGNWFFLTDDPEDRIGLGEVKRLTQLGWEIRRGLEAAGIRGDDGAEIDHVHLGGSPSRSDADARAFVLCPGGAYDRSPCGTGTSAKLACLHARGLLAEGRPWRIESVVGSSFVGRYTKTEAGIVPTIRGRAHVTAEAVLHFSEDDPFRGGIGG